MSENNNKLKINYKNLILGAAVGYTWDDLKILIKSLRKFSNCRVILIFENSLSDKLQNKFKNYNIDYFIYKEKNKKNIPGLINSKSDVGQRRYEMYEFVLESIKKKPNKILLTDTRDVVFQSDIFKYNLKRSLNFFLESEKILNDPRNVRWLKRTVGEQVFNKIKNNLISCSGTTLGNFEEIMNYIRLMKKKLYFFPYKRPLRHIISLKNVEPYDQGIHNYLIYSKFFKDVECHKNNVSIICTTAYMKNFRFNKEGQLLNDQDEIYSAIHQYDRSFYNNGSPVFNFKKIYD